MLFVAYGLAAGLIGFTILFGLWCLISRQILKFDCRKVIFSMALAFPICLLGEIISGYIHLWFFNHYLWFYTIRPLHSNFTSAYNFAIWPLYGWHIYLCDQALEKFELTPRQYLWATCLKLTCSGLGLEIIANVLMIISLGRFYFYYTPDDLFHLTSLQVVPYYTLCSLALMLLLRKMRHSTPSYFISLLLYSSGLIILFL